MPTDPLSLDRGVVCDERFEIERPVGAGGMGTIYRARDRRTGKPVAIKILHDIQAEDRARFSREARILAELRHPRIVRYIAQGSLADGQPYLVLEWLEGCDLGRYLQRHGRLSVDTAVSIARGLAEALRAMHAKGVLHRDIKPSNVFLRGASPAAALLLDFGVAFQHGLFRLTRTGAVVGTPEYMAPEQVRRDAKLGPEMDIYSIGSVLFDCLAGRPPFVARGVSDLLSKLLVEPAPRLSDFAEVPDALDAVVAKMLEKSPAQRVANADALLCALEPFGGARDP